MSACIVCLTSRELPMNDNTACERWAIKIIQGLLLPLGSKGSLASFVTPRRRGVCIVERCARSVEAPCGGCRKSACQRCAIAAELRAAEDRINDARDAELIELGVDDTDLEAVIDAMINNLCTDHTAFGAVLAGQWYGRQSFLFSSTVVDARHGP